MLTGIIVGAVVGAGLALMYAPCSGKETREWLARKSKELKDRTESAYEEAKATVRTEATGFVGDVKDAVRTQAVPSYNASDNKARA
jgi:gas vesicle protein